MRKGLAIFLCVLMIATTIVIPLPSKALDYGMATVLSNSDASFWGESADDYSGLCVAIAGDVNGDGFDDILIGAQYNDEGGDKAGQVYLIFGKGSGWAMDTDLSKADASFWGENWDDYAGYSVAGAGDVNGDGYDDILIGAYANRDGGNSAGQTYLIFGKAQGWAKDTNLSKSDASFWGENDDDRSGWSVAGAGDVNGDGYDDILIGAYGNDDGGTDAGQSYLILGKASGWAMDTDLSNADASFWGEGNDDASGEVVTRGGDVNKDGYDDILIGAYGNDAGGSVAGQTYLIFGKASGWAPDTDLSQADASFWGEIAGDRSGGSVTGVGDVNNDGYDDILIGAFSNSEKAYNAGQTYLIFGKATGLAMDTDLSNADASFWGECSSEYSGSSIARAGDVNGDGYDDILIGSYGCNVNYMGQTNLILGKATGWAPDTDLSGANASFKGEFVSDNSGRSIAGAGDVNADGYDDILIGAFGNDAGGNSAGQTYLIFADTNSRPTTINSIKAYSDNTFSKEISQARVNDTIFMELQGTDGNLSRKDTTVVNVTSNESSPMGFSLRLIETGQSTGKYRGNFTIANRTHKDYRWIDASFGETITITSVQDPNKKTTVLVECPDLSLWPSKDTLFAPEDAEYKVHYWATGWADLGWTFESNASWLVWDETGHDLFGTPDNEDIGSYWARINVTCVKRCSKEHNFTLTVNNTPPTINTTNIITTMEDQALLVDYNSTDDGQGTISWHLKTDASAWLSIDPLTGILSGIPGNDDVGQHYVNVSVDDGNDGWDSTNFTLTVVNINDPPQIIGTDVTTVYEDAQYRSNYTLTDADPNDKVFSWELATNASWLIFDPAIGLITGSPDNSDVGSYWVNISVKDLAKAQAFRNFTLTVLNVNDPPQWVDVPSDSTMKDTDIFTAKVSATDIDADDALTFGLEKNPAGMTIGANNGTLTWRPTISQIGTHNITINVTDGHAVRKHNFTIVVSSSDLYSPIITSIPGTIAIVGQQYTYDIKATDQDSTHLKFGLDVHPSGMILEQTTLRVTWEPDTTNMPIVSIILFVTDGYHTVHQSWNITVLAKPPNHPPVIKNACMNDLIRPYRAGETVHCDYLATDADNDTLVWSITGVQDLTFKDGTVTWTPKKAGTYTLKFNVSDGKGGFDEKTKTITIEPKKSDGNGLGALMIGGIVGVVAAVVAVVGAMLWQKKSSPKKPKGKEDLDEENK